MKRRYFNITGGVLAVGLGWIGMLLSAVVFIAAWWGQARLSEPISEMADTLAAVCDQVSSGATGVTGRVEFSRQALSALETKATERVGEFADSSGLDLSKLVAVRSGAEVGIAKLRGWLDVAESAAIVLEQLRDGISDAAGFVRTAPDERDDLRTAIDVGRVRVDEALLLLEEIDEQVIALRADPTAPRTSEALDRLCTRLDTALLDVVLEVTGFTDRVDGLRDTILNTAEGVTRRLWLIALLLSLLCAWNGAAQFCLAQAGWRELRRHRSHSSGA
jgi:hypothetical protein